MTSPKQDQRPKTLIEYMGFKDPDLNDFNHDEWCLKLLNKKLIEKIIRTKIFEGSPEKLNYGEKFTFYKYDKQRFDPSRHEWTNETLYYKTNDITGEYLTLTKIFYENIEPYRIRKIDIKTLELEHVLVKHGNNNYSQRLGFLDVFCLVFLEDKYFININGEEIPIQRNEHDGKEYVLFFEVKTSKQTIGSIAREIEYYRQATSEIYHCKITPFLVAKEKLPITQFETITFDEILQLEKEFGKEV